MRQVPVMLLIISIVLIFSKPAHAYLDPGTGSIVFQAVIGTFLAAAATGKLWWGKLKGIFGGSSKKNSDKDE